MHGFSSDDCFDLLGPYHDRLLAAIQRAWKRWAGDLAPKMPGCRVSPMRTIVQELIVQEIRTDFADDAEVTIIETPQHHFLLQVPVVDNDASILLRFKHLDRQMRTANYRTPGSDDFDCHRPLPGIPDGLRLNVGYRLDEADADLSDVRITRAHGDKILWDYALWERGADVTHLRPQQANLNLGEGRKRRARPKPSAKQRRSVDDER